MADKTSEDLDLALTEKLIFEKNGLKLEKIEETSDSKTPDFRVLLDGKLVAFCEVKSPRNDWLETLLKSANPFQIVGGARNDPTFNRIARHVNKATAQFRTVNADHEVPNILVFVNHDDASNYNDLTETLTGFFESDTGKKYRTMSHVSEKMIGKSKYEIDLYVWINTGENKIQGCVFNENNPKTVKYLCGLLGLDASKLKTN